MEQATVRRVVALGFFDGVHLGHGALLRCARKLADQLGCPAAAMSMDAHPRSLVSGQPAQLLGAMADRERLMRRFYRMDEVVFEHFDQQMMHLPWQDFIETYVVKGLNACHVVCGDDYRFGYKGQGTAELLKEACAARGIGCSIIPRVELDGIRISSTVIRERILQGDIPAARRFLGHPHLLGGEVVRGNQLGRTIGVPTANIPFAPDVLVPPYGVYCARVEHRGVLYPAVVNIGVHPTAGNAPQPMLEAWIYGLDKNLYGQHLDVWLYEMLRPERKFASMEDLQGQIMLDAQKTRQYFGS